MRVRRTLMAAGHPRAPALVRRALADPDSDVTGAVVRGLGELDAAWAADALVEVLRRDGYARSRVASQLERMSLGIAPLLEPLLEDAHPAVRFWAATLLGRCTGVEPARLIPLTRDVDPNVRAAAVEGLAELGATVALQPVRDRLRDETWFVRVHACRAVGRLGSANDAAAVASRLGDPWWWVRSAAKDSLRGWGMEAAGVLVAHLDADDAFVRNGAAEILQDIGFLDALASSGPEGELRDRILAAGGRAMRKAAEARRLNAQPERRPVAGVGA
jgi:HEAT repeat protein